MSKVWSLCMEFYGAWQEVAMHHRTPYTRTKLWTKSMVSLKMSILQIWASKITLKNLESHTPWTSHAAALWARKSEHLSIFCGSDGIYSVVPCTNLPSMSSPATLYTIEQELLVKAKKSLEVSVSALLCSCFFFFSFFFLLFSFYSWFGGKRFV